MVIASGKSRVYEMSRKDRKEKGRKVEEERRKEKEKELEGRYSE